MVLKSHNCNESTKLFSLLGFIDVCVKTNNFSELNYLLNQKDIFGTSALLSVSLVRHTHPYREYLNDWTECVKGIETFLRSKSLDLKCFNIEHN